MAGQRPFVVTTRSRLHHRRHIPAMTLATRRILRELDRTDGSNQVASIISAPREFWSVSVWSTRHQMQEFMRSGAHGTYLWQVSDWLDSFWLMRWRPTRHERGAWNGVPLAPAAQPAPLPHVADEIRDQILASIPRLRDAFGSDGRPTFDTAPQTRLERELLDGATGAIMRIPSRLTRTGTGRHLRRLRRHLAGDPDLIRMVGGIGQRGGGYLLGVWQTKDGAGRLIDSRWAEDLERRYGEDFWACELIPENEFGHWDGLKLRDGGLFGQLGAQPAPNDETPS